MQTVFKYIYMFYTFRRPHFAGPDIHFIRTQTISRPYLPDSPKAWQPPHRRFRRPHSPSAIFLYTCRKTIPLFPFMPERPSEKTFNVKEVIFLRYCALNGFTLYCRTLRLRNIANRLSEEKKENSMAQITLDKTDLKILQVLQSNGRLTNVELSERVALSPSPCLRRLKQLEDAGIIRQYAALLSPQEIKLGLQAFIRVSIDKSGELRDRFAQTVQTWPEVLSCFALTGETDYLLHTFFPDMNAFSHFVLDTLLSHPGVQDAKSSFVLKELKNTTALPLGHLQTTA